MRFPPLSTTASTYMVNGHRVSSVYRVKGLRTDGVHCRESDGTGPVVLNAVPVMSAAFFRFHHGQFVMRLSFFTPTMASLPVALLHVLNLISRRWASTCDMKRLPLPPTATSPSCPMATKNLPASPRFILTYYAKCQDNGGPTAWMQ